MATAFYDTPEWKALRAATLKRDGYRCVMCGRSVQGYRQSRVDHIHERKTHPHLALDPNNVRTLCAVCDNKRHRAKGGQGPARTAEQGPAQARADGYPEGSDW